MCPDGEGSSKVYMISHDPCMTLVCYNTGVQPNLFNKSQKLHVIGNSGGAKGGTKEIEHLARAGWWLD